MATKHLHLVTNSEIEDFDRCHAYWGYRYAELLRPLEEPISIGYGDLYHEGCQAGWMAAWWDPELPNTSRRTNAAAAGMAAIRVLAGKKLNEVLARGSLSLDQIEALEAEYAEHTEIAQWALFHYFQQPTTDLDLVPLAIEASFDVPIPTRSGQGGMLHQSGKMDLVLWDRQACQIILEDHKTTGYAVQSYEGKLALIPQPTGYLRALGVLLERVYRDGWWPAGPGTGFWSHTTPAAMQLMQRHRKDIAGATLGQIAFNVSRRAKPKKPDVNLLRAAKGILAVNPRLAALAAAQEQDGLPRGEVSAAEIDTLPEVYEAALVEQESARGQPRTEKQLARLGALAGKTSSFFARHEFYRGPEELERWRAEMWVKAKALREAEKYRQYRTRNPHACTGPAAPKCLYASICTSPGDPVARAGFRVAATRHEELDHAGPGNTVERTGGSGAGLGAPDGVGF